MFRFVTFFFHINTICNWFPRHTNINLATHNWNKAIGIERNHNSSAGKLNGIKSENLENFAGIWNFWPEVSRNHVTLSPSILHQKICFLAQNITRQTKYYEYKKRSNWIMQTFIEKLNQTRNKVFCYRFCTASESWRVKTINLI